MNDDLRELVEAAEAVLYGTEDGGTIPGELRSRLNFALLPFDGEDPKDPPGPIRAYVDLFGVAAIRKGTGTAWEYGRPGVRLRAGKPDLRLDNIAYTGKPSWAVAGAVRDLKDAFRDRTVELDDPHALTSSARLLAGLGAKFVGWIPKLLRLLREKRGWTQAQLAEKAGIHQHTISGWETGRTDPSIRVLYRVLVALAD